MATAVSPAVVDTVTVRAPDVCWACIIIVEYPLCLWFAGVKQRRRDPWLSYL